MRKIHLEVLILWTVAVLGSIIASGGVMKGASVKAAPEAAGSNRPSDSDRRVPKDLSGVRGFNYTGSSATGHSDHFLHYKPEETDRELDLAARLKLNQARVFIMYDVYAKEKEALRRNLLHFVRACHQRGIGVMIVVGYPRPTVAQKVTSPAAVEFARFLVETLSNEPGLAFWDVANEPHNKLKTEEELNVRRASVRYMAGVFHELDKKTPVTVGAAWEGGMEDLADCVNVLSFHDYSATRARIRANMERARSFAAKLGKPVFNSEIGCVARANPYDVILEEYMRAGMGWYVWELMITGSHWGPIHGVFYGDGTVRDPSIAGAILGFFRNRGEEVVPENVDQENRVTRTVAQAKKWLERNPGSWEEGLAVAETAANLLEAGQLTALRELPTRQVDLMRNRQPDLPALRALLTKYIEILGPYQKQK